MVRRCVFVIIPRFKPRGVVSNTGCVELQLPVVGKASSATTVRVGVRISLASVLLLSKRSVMHLSHSSSVSMTDRSLSA